MTRSKSLRKGLSALPLVLCLNAAAEEPQGVKVPANASQEVNRTEFSLGLEYAQISATKGALTGYGVNFGFDYALSPRWAVSTKLGQAFQSGTTGLGYLYTAIGAGLQFAVTGGFMHQQQTVASKGSSWVEEYSKKEPTLKLGLGVEQMLFNGSSSVYPAPGFTLGIAYQFQGLGRWLSAGARYGTFSVNSETMSGMFVNFSILLGQD